MSHVYISPEDVFGYLESVMKRFEAQNDTDCVAYHIATSAIENGYISLNDFADIASYCLNGEIRRHKDYSGNMYGYLVKKKES